VNKSTVIIVLRVKRHYVYWWNTWRVGSVYVWFIIS